MNVNQLLPEKLAEQFLEVGPQASRFDLVLGQQRSIGRVDRRRIRQGAPHPRANRVEPEVHLGVQIDQNRFVADHAKQHIRSDANAVRERDAHAGLTARERCRECLSTVRAVGGMSTA